MFVNICHHSKHVNLIAIAIKGRRAGKQIGPHRLVVGPYRVSKMCCCLCFRCCFYEDFCKSYEGHRICCRCPGAPAGQHLSVQTRRCVLTQVLTLPSAPRLGKFTSSINLDFPLPPSRGEIQITCVHGSTRTWVALLDKIPDIVSQ